jgi:hypothetical protein
MAVIIRDRVQKLAADGRSLAQIKAARPVIGWEARYGHPAWTTEMFLEAIHPDFVSRAPQAPGGASTSPARPRGAR